MLAEILTLRDTANSQRAIQTKRTSLTQSKQLLGEYASCVSIIRISAVAILCTQLLRWRCVCDGLTASIPVCSDIISALAVVSVSRSADSQLDSVDAYSLVLLISTRNCMTKSISPVSHV